MDYPYNLYRCTDPNNNGNEDTDLQVIKDWRDNNAVGSEIRVIVINQRNNYNVHHQVNTYSYLIEADADAMLANLPGSTKSITQEEFEESDTLYPE